VSTISDALKKTQEPRLLVELYFDGLIIRYTLARWGNISVPYSGYDERLFEGLITNNLNVKSSFEWRNFKYSIANVPITIWNKERLQDHEKTRRLDGGIGKIYLWTDGLDWTDIDPEGLIFRGVFKKEWHDKYSYSFNLVDDSDTKFRLLPETTINTDTFPLHRTEEGGAGSVAGMPQPLLYGDWTKGIPLKNVKYDTTTPDYEYLACVGVVKSSEAEYNAGTEFVYTSTDSTVNPANYTFYPGGLDGQGHVVAYFDFGANDQTTSEPLHCSIRGLTDGSGEITGTAGTLIEHPSHIIEHLLRYHTGLNPLNDEIDFQSIKTMASILPGLKFATIINQSVSGVDVVDRILSECRCARIPRQKGLGIMTFDLDAVRTGIIKRTIDVVDRTIRISKTPDNRVCNNLRVSYGLNPMSGQYEGEVIYDWTNNSDCESSYYQYGERPQVELRLSDVQAEYVARYLAKRYLDIYTFRHDIAIIEVPYWTGWDIIEGDAGQLTLEEGSSHTGTGWINEEFILIERQFKPVTIRQTWWRVDTR